MTTKYNHSRTDREVAKKIVRSVMGADNLGGLETAIADALFIARNEATAAIVAKFATQISGLEKKSASNNTLLEKLESDLKLGELIELFQKAKS